MFESRCGVCCGNCGRRKQVDCKGCTNMAMPFWGGECKVKACCEGRGLDHCGQCDGFPCAMLSNMGREQGYDSGERIAQCRRWAEEETAALTAASTLLL